MGLPKNSEPGVIRLKMKNMDADLEFGEIKTEQSVGELYKK